MAPLLRKCFAKLNNNDQLGYIDSGLPAEGQYHTYILLPGLGHDNGTFLQMVEMTPPGTRCIAVSPRGYPPSSPFYPTQLTSGVKLFACLGHDLASLVVHLLNSLGLLSDPGNTVSLLGWSFGNASIISAYYLLSQSPSPLSTEEQNALSTKVSRYICYEGPEAVMAMPEAPDRAANRAKMLEQLAQCSAPAERLKIAESYYERFLSYVTGFYSYDQSIEAFHVISTDQPSRDDLVPEKYIKPCIHPLTYMDIFLTQARYEDSQENATMALTAAFQKMLECQIFVLGLLTANSAPSNHKGMLRLNDLMSALDKSGRLWTLKRVHGRYNHYLHNYDPDALWREIRGHKES